jgi:penicillin-binding protein 1C
MTRRAGLRWAALFLSAGLAAASVFIPYPRRALEPGPGVSLRLLDRHGFLLREVLSEAGGRCRWVGLEEVSPHLVRATLAAEDRRFFFHRGVSLPSVLRAISQNARGGRIVSGASTITQQVVRNLHPRPRTWPVKLLEGWLALRLERTLNKEAILVQYLNRVPYGNLAFGAEAASRLYFGKPAFGLSLAESAFLAGLPRSPTTSNPYAAPAAARARQREILSAMASLGWAGEEETARALVQPLDLQAPTAAFRAPHFCEQVLAEIGPEKRSRLSAARTTLDLALQEKVESLVRRHINPLASKGITNAAVVVMQNATGEILALAGSRDFFARDDAGQVDGARAPRQPGSALKPFTYALALERGLTAASLIADEPTGFAAPGGAFVPRNYDRLFHGRVRLRSALACSYNVPAVATLEAAVGTETFYRTLRALGFDGLRRPPSYYGAGLTLGNGEVTLLELAGAYRALARAGIFGHEWRILETVDRSGLRGPSPAPGAGVPVLSPPAVFIVTDILADADARVPAFGYGSPLSLPFPCAAKTGTSKDYRDNWTVGFTKDYTVAVWAGNFDGEPMHQVSGIAGCGPIFRDIMLLLHRDRRPGPFIEPPGLVRRDVCASSGRLAGLACPGRIREVFEAGTEPSDICFFDHARVRASAVPAPARRMPERAERPEARTLDPKIQIIGIEDGAVFRLDPVLRPEHQKMRCRAILTGLEDVRSVEWWLNGRRAAVVPGGAGWIWRLRPGSYTIVAVIVTRAGRLSSRPARVTILL